MRLKLQNKLITQTCENSKICYVFLEWNVPEQSKKTGKAHHNFSFGLLFFNKTALLFILPEKSAMLARRGRKNFAIFVTVLLARVHNQKILIFGTLEGLLCFSFYEQVKPIFIHTSPSYAAAEEHCVCSLIII